MDFNFHQVALLAGEVGAGLARVRSLTVLTFSYLIFWSPLFVVTLLSWSWTWEEAKNSTAHLVSADFALL